MSFKAHWHSFCTTTGIKAFLFIHTSHSLLEKTLWIVTLTIACAATIYDVSSTVITYKSVPTATKVSVMPNKTFILDSLLICLLQKSDEINSNGLKISNTSQVAELLGRFEDVNLTDYLAAKMRYLAPFNYYYEDRPEPDVNFSQILFIHSFALSIAMRAELVENDNLTVTDLLTFQPNMSDSLQLIYDYYRRHNYSAPILIKHIAASLWCATILTVTFRRSFLSDTIDDHCKPELISWFGHLPLDSSTDKYRLLNCIKLSPYVLQFSSTRDTVDIAFDSSYIHKMNRNSFFGIYTGSKPVLTEETDNVLYLQEGFNHMVNVRMAGHYKMFSSKRSKCFEGQSYFNCLLQRRGDYILKHCGCLPVYSAFVKRSNRPFIECVDVVSNKTKLVLAGYTKSAKCLNITKTEVRDSIKHKCFEQCERKMFQLVGRKTHSQDDHNPNFTATTIWLFIDSFVYTVFEEAELMDTRHFFSQLGGNLSFWLGASFLVLLHVVVFVAKNGLTAFEGIFVRNRIGNYESSRYKERSGASS